MSISTPWYVLTYFIQLKSRYTELDTTGIWELLVRASCVRCTEVSTINSVFSLLSPPVTFHPEKGHRLLINICRGNSLLSSICTRVHFVMLYLYNGTIGLSKVCMDHYSIQGHTTRCYSNWITIGYRTTQHFSIVYGSRLDTGPHTIWYSKLITIGYETTQCFSIIYGSLLDTGPPNSLL